MRFRLIVFDWDGTLMDSEAKIVACIQAAFADLGKPPPGREAARNVIGLGIADATAEIWPEADAADKSRIAERYRFHYRIANRLPSPLFPGAQELLDWLLERGFLLAVATGKSRRGLDLVFDETGLADRFHTTRCADESHSKPHPEMLLQIMDELGVDGARTLMIGDTEYDMRMARGAGTDALAVGYGVHERERLLAQRPLDCLGSLPELRSWLERVEVI
ncbi:MAG: HAD-IA family hydrolase [Candidatus Thiosymbion ectosymbiont of Robbea hypermnestra]|nr:HAD-IA family hydrolase [Candidatus Thiosymbion ectosymbiont of Robbea hypermnestra]